MTPDPELDRFMLDLARLLREELGWIEAQYATTKEAGE